MIEFQSTDHPFMAVRVLDYEDGLYRQLVRALKLERGDLLPLVLPLVLYRGWPAWKWRTPRGRRPFFVPSEISRRSR